MTTGSGNVHMKSYSLETVTKWIAEYSTVATLELVTRINVGGVNGRWQ